MCLKVTYCAIIYNPAGVPKERTVSVIAYNEIQAKSMINAKHSGWKIKDIWLVSPVYKVR
jgi:hypothetical protein